VKVGTGNVPLASPHNVEVDRQNKYFYVTLISEGSVEKFDANTYEKLNRAPLVSNPGHVVISQDGFRGFVTNYNASGTERYVKVFDTQTMSEIYTISDITLNGSHGARLTNDGNYFICVSEIAEFVQIIRTSDYEIEEKIPVAENVPPNGNGTGLYLPIAVSVSPDDKYAFITCRKSNEVKILDLQTRTIFRTISVGLSPIQSECSPDGRWLYVANRNSNTVTVIDLSGFSVYKTISSVGIQPHGVSFTKDGRFAYITCESRTGTFIHHAVTGSDLPGTTAIIDVANGHVKVKDIEMASYPAGISITK
jgi:YVTN family beta-propeller protein